MAERAHIHTKHQIEYGSGAFSHRRLDLGHFLGDYIYDTDKDVWIIDKENLKQVIENLKNLDEEEDSFLPYEMSKDYTPEELIGIFEIWLRDADPTHDEIYIEWF